MADETTKEGKATPLSEPQESRTQTADALSSLDTVKKKEVADALINILRSIPLIGPYIVIIKLKWGWSGILLLVAGFLIAAVLVGTGLYPARAVSSAYRTREAAPAEKIREPVAVNSDCEVQPQAEVKWDKVVRDAKTRVLATGIALSRIDPKILSEKVRSGVSAKIIYLDPCRDTVKRRQDDENNQNAAINIKTAIGRLANLVRDFTPAQRQLLTIMKSDVYPTMVVIIVDNDLYAYFCPYGGVCSNSPVVIFKNYVGNDSANFFETHFNNVLKKSDSITDLDNPCGAAPPATPTPTTPSG